jgi:Flp pilus assembly protein TadG
MGAATVEMAMVAPFIILLVFGSVEFARMMMVRQALTNAAREACRHVCLVTTQNNVCCSDVVREKLRGVIKNVEETDVLRIETVPSFSTFLDPGTLVTTTVEVDCADVSWLPAFFTAGAKIRATSRMSRE